MKFDWETVDRDTGEVVADYTYDPSEYCVREGYYVTWWWAYYLPNLDKAGKYKTTVDITEEKRDDTWDADWTFSISGKPKPSLTVKFLKTILAAFR